MGFGDRVKKVFAGSGESYLEREKRKKTEREDAKEEESTEMFIEQVSKDFDEQVQDRDITTPHGRLDFFSDLIHPFTRVTRSPELPHLIRTDTIHTVYEKLFVGNSIAEDSGSLARRLEGYSEGRVSGPNLGEDMLDATRLVKGRPQKDPDFLVSTDISPPSNEAGLEVGADSPDIQQTIIGEDEPELSAAEWEQMLSKYEKQYEDLRGEGGSPALRMWALRMMLQQNFALPVMTTINASLYQDVRTLSLSRLNDIYHRLFGILFENDAPQFINEYNRSLEAYTSEYFKEDGYISILDLVFLIGMAVSSDAGDDIERRFPQDEYARREKRLPSSTIMSESDQTRQLPSGEPA